jgi:D-lyxose ketol-isomerase
LNDLQRLSDIRVSSRNEVNISKEKNKTKTRATINLHRIAPHLSNDIQKGDWDFESAPEFLLIFNTDLNVDVLDFGIALEMNKFLNFFVIENALLIEYNAEKGEFLRIKITRFQKTFYLKILIKLMLKLEIF